MAAPLATVKAPSATVAATSLPFDAETSADALISAALNSASLEIVAPLLEAYSAVAAFASTSLCLDC